MKAVLVLSLLCFSIALLNAAAVPKPVVQPVHPIFRFTFPDAGHKILGRTGETGNANAYMDEVLALVREQIVIQGYDRIQLPDGDFAFDMDGITGGVYLHDGLATGMETLHRVGDATLSNDDTIVYFSSDCGINNGAFGYAISIKFMDIGPTASMTGTATYVNFYFHSTIDILSGLVVVDVFNIKQVGHISTDITGLGPFNWLAETIANFAINLIAPFFKELLEGPITKLINTVLQEYVNNMLHPPALAAKLVA